MIFKQKMHVAVYSLKCTIYGKQNRVKGFVDASDT